MIIRIRKSKTNRQNNDQKKNYNRTNIDIQNTTQKTKDQAPRTPLKPGVIPDALEGQAVLDPLTTAMCIT